MQDWEFWGTVVPTWITALATLGLVGGVFAAWATLKQAEKDSIRRTRPYVHAVLVPSLWGPGHWDLKIHNAGQSAARGLTIGLSDWPEKNDLITDGLRQHFAESQILPPGVSYRVIWRSTLQEGDTPTPDSPLRDKVHGIPGKATLTLRYRGGDPKEDEYKDIYVLNPDLVEPITPAPSRGPEVKSRVSRDQEDTHRMLQEIVSAIREQRYDE